MFGFTPVKEVGAVMQQTNSECRTLAYIGIILTILSSVLVTILHYRKSKFCKGHRFSNTVNIMIFISDVQNYIPVKLCKTAGGIHLSFGNQSQARQAITECICPIRGLGSQTSYQRMHKPRQAIPEFSVNMHWIKEAAEAQILRQAELH